MTAPLATPVAPAVAVQTRTDVRRRFDELKLLARKPARSVYLCHWKANVLAPAVYVEATARRLQTHPEYRGKCLVVMKRSDPASTPSDAVLVQLLRQLGPHPNLAALFDAFVADDEGSGGEPPELCQIFEQMEGSLGQFIKSRKQRRTLPEALLSSVITQITSGLDHLHSRHIVHRTLSPEHILVTTTGLQYYYRAGAQADATSASQPPVRKDVTVIVKITGFSCLTSLMPGLGSTAAAAPLPAISRYTSPDLLLLPAVPLSEAEDIWALGVIARELMTLQPLFTCRSPQDLFARWCAAIGPPKEGSAMGEEDVAYSPAAVSWARVHASPMALLPATSLAYGRIPGFTRSLVAFIASLIAWNPLTRPSTSSILSHPALRAHILIPTSPTPNAQTRASPSSAPGGGYRVARPETAPSLANLTYAGTTEYSYAYAEHSNEAATRPSTGSTPRDGEETASLAPSYRSRYSHDSTTGNVPAPPTVPSSNVSSSFASPSPAPRPHTSTGGHVPTPSLARSSSYGFPSHPASNSPMTTLPQYSDYPSDPSSDLFARALNSPHVLTAQVGELCEYIRRLPRVVSEGDWVGELIRRKEDVNNPYSHSHGKGKRGGGSASGREDGHEFLLVKIVLAEKGAVWVRLERLPKTAYSGTDGAGPSGSGGGTRSRPSTAGAGSSGASGFVGASDLASLSHSPLELYDKDTSSPKARAEFRPGHTTLAMLGKVLSCVEAECDSFPYWPDNRYFFCSITHELLGGTLTDGVLANFSMGARQRKRIRARFLDAQMQERSLLGSAHGIAAPGSVVAAGGDDLYGEDGVVEYPIAVSRDGNEDSGEFDSFGSGSASANRPRSAPGPAPGSGSAGQGRGGRSRERSRDSPVSEHSPARARTADQQPGGQPQQQQQRGSGVITRARSRVRLLR